MALDGLTALMAQVSIADQVSLQSKRVPNGNRSPTSPQRASTVKVEHSAASNTLTAHSEWGTDGRSTQNTEKESSVQCPNRFTKLRSGRDGLLVTHQSREPCAHNRAGRNAPDPLTQRGSVLLPAR